MSIRTIILCTILLVIAFAQVQAADLPYKPDELIVRFAPKVDGQQRTRIERNEILASIVGGTVKRFTKLVPGLGLVKLPDNVTVEKALAAFKNAQGILYAEPNYKIKLLSTFPDDPRFNEQWGLHNTGQTVNGTSGTVDADIDAPEAWDIHTGSSDIIVAVIDTGVDYNHPDLSANMWVNTGEQPGDWNGDGKPGVAGFDDDGDGLVDEDSEDRQPGDPNYTNDLVNDDDENGYNDDIYGYDFGSGDADPMDYDGHGTYVAGIIGAVGNNNEGVTGVCWNVKIMALNIDTAPFTWEAFVSNAIEAIDYAVEMGANILNSSWGVYDYEYTPQGLKEEIEAADANGVLFIVAAGNKGYNIDEPGYKAYPAGYDCNNIISVMATDKNDERAVWSGPSDSSNWGANSVDLAAPGSDILSCLRGQYEWPEWPAGYGYAGGTSAAAPHVAGAAALVWSANPALNHLQVKQIILRTVDKKPWLENDPNLGRLSVTGGRLNLYNALFEVGLLVFSKTDDVNDSVLPGDNITYTIYFENSLKDPNDANLPFGDLTDVTIVDYLPDEVDYPDPFDPDYDMLNRTYTWNIGTLSPGEANSVTLTVRVNQLAEPLGKITNICVIDANQIRLATAIETTDVNVWNPGVIYVNKNATVGSNTGMSWEDAYTNLQIAFERAGAGGGSQIWVAAGTYKPTTDPLDFTATFALIDGVALYGGFAGTETSRSRRNWLTNETVLTGDVDNDGYVDIDYVVSGLDVNETTVIDGFTIMKGFYAGVYLN
ncbi:MAG: S8 family serine peptidase, partial [Planctomycetes bacterium]|nr:S8 family serine peptidase [Planctomycetota bacterium]